MKQLITFTIVMACICYALSSFKTHVGNPVAKVRDNYQVRYNVED